MLFKNKKRQQFAVLVLRVLYMCLVTQKYKQHLLKH